MSDDDFMHEDDDNGFGNDDDDFGNDDDGFGDDTMPDEDGDFEDNSFPDSDDDGLAANDEPELTPEEQLENMFAMAEDNDDKEAAIQELEQVIEKDLEYFPDKREWSFKAVVLICQLRHSLGDYDQMLTDLKRLFELLNLRTLRDNEKAKGVKDVLEAVKNCPNLNYRARFFRSIMDALASSNSATLLAEWARAAKLLASNLLELQDWTQLTKVIKELKAFCNEEILRRANHMVETYTIEIQMYAALENFKKTGELYELANNLNMGVVEDKVKAILKEFGGRTMMARGDYREAFFLFKDSFNSYNAFGSPRRLVLLKYMILTSMMHTEGGLNVFGEQDTAAFQHDPEVKPMADLLVAYERNDVLRCERIISEHKNVIMCDEFIKSNIASMLYTVRGQVLLKLVDPYRRIRVDSLAKLLNIASSEVEELIVAMILDRKINGKLDQVNHVLLIDPPMTELDRKYNAINRWVSHMGTLNATVCGKLSL